MRAKNWRTQHRFVARAGFAFRGFEFVILTGMFTHIAVTVVCIITTAIQFARVGKVLQVILDNRGRCVAAPGDSTMRSKTSEQICASQSKSC